MYKKIKISKIIFGLIVLLGFTLILIDTLKDRKMIIRKQFSGIIIDIRITKYSRGFPDVKIFDKWVPIGGQSGVNHYIHIGDSIVKEPGVELIKVYRKNSENTWDVKIFK